MYRSSMWALGLACALVGTDARADTLSLTRSQPVREVSHSVDVRIVDGVARYTVRRTFANSGARADEATVEIDLPPGAAATGLRIRARDRWYRGELLEAGLAREKYRELTGLGAFEPKDPALLQWLWSDRLHLQVFPVLANGANTVEYTLTAPVRYRNGRYVLAYPRGGETPEDSAPLATPVLRVFPGYGDATMPILVDGQRTVLDAPVVLSPPKAPIWYGEGEPSDNASYIHSRIAVAGEHKVRSARVKLAIDHTYRGDLEVELVTPEGAAHRVFDGSGSENDIRGTYTVSLPEPTPQAGNWYLRVADTAGLDVGTLESWSLELDVGKAEKSVWTTAKKAGDVPMFIPDAPEHEGDGGLALIELDPPAIRNFAARVGRVVASDDNSFLRVEVDAAPQLRKLPRRASVVFVVDASYSMEESGIDRQLALARAYASHLPDAAFEVIAYRRHAQRVFGAFTPAAAFATSLEQHKAQGKLGARNGSAMEEGLELAAKALQGRAGPKRIVVLSDELLRSRFSPTMGVQAVKQAPRGTITHLVVPDHNYEFEMKRDDKDVLASIPRAHRGVLYRVNFPSDVPQKVLAADILGLVRPVALENFKIRAAGLNSSAWDVPDVLAEGQGVRVMTRASEVPRQAVISGMLWGTTIRRTVRATQAFSRATAAFVFSEDEHDDLSEAEMMTVAMFGRAVSPVTSYLATEPGVRPSTAGINYSLVGRGGGGGGAGYGGIGRGSGRNPRSYTLEELVSKGIQKCMSKHQPGPSWKLELKVESTLQEIVDVIPQRKPASAMDTCAVEAVWNTRLSWNFKHERKLHPLVLKSS